MLAAALAWTVIGGIYALPSLSNGRMRDGEVLASMLQWWAWGLLTPLIIAVDRWLPLSSKQLPQRFAAHLIPSLLFTVAHIYMVAVMRAVTGLGAWDFWTSRFLINALVGMFLWSWLVYWLILCVWQAYQYHGHYMASELQAERLERRLSEARLNTLRMQLDPHFLFNALNTISSQVEREPRLARGMISHLGDLLRLSLESKDKQEVPLVEEMEFVEHYIAIQKIRFGDELQIERHIAPDVRYAAVPCQFIQPLVENAIRHGVAGRATLGTVVISARRLGNRLEIRVEDDGVGLPAGWALERSQGLGLSLTRARIEGVYPDGSSQFSVTRREGGGTTASILLPLRVNHEEAHGPDAA